MLLILQKSIFIVFIILLHYNKLFEADAALNETTTSITQPVENWNSSDSKNKLACFAHIRRPRNYTFCYYCCAKSIRSRYCYCDLVPMEYCRQDWLPVLRKLPKFDCMWNIQAYTRY